jgi:hypothetical protein
MKKFIVLDTETAPTCAGELEARNSRVYDLGYIVTDNTGAIYEAKSFIIADTFFNHALMDSAYYANKTPIYYNGIGTLWQVKSFLDAYKEFMLDCRKYEITDIWAYNMNFDRQALNATIEDYSKGFKGFFFPYKTKFHDIWDYAGSTICNTKKYVKWCLSNGYVSDKGNPSTSAETVYRYISTDNTFNEEHTALSDCRIELAILLKCKKRNQKHRQSCGQGWRDASKIAKDMRKEEEKNSENS